MKNDEGWMKISPVITRQLLPVSNKNYRSFVIRNSAFIMLPSFSFNILNHLANSLDRRFNLNDVLGNFRVVCFRADCVGFTQHFLD